MKIMASSRKCKAILSVMPDLIRHPVFFWIARSAGRAMTNRKNVSSLWICGIALALLCFCFDAPSGAFKLPDTGQTTCYDQGGNVISCPAPGQPLAQDGSYNINPLSYTDNGNGTVTDNNTGLIWQQEDDGNIYNWYVASGTYDTTYNPTSQDVCGSLNLGDHSDWRLPAKKELMTIVAYGIPYPGPAIDTTYFPNTKLAVYWSSSSRASYPNGAWCAWFDDGSVVNYSKGTPTMSGACVADSLPHRISSTMEMARLRTTGPSLYGSRVSRDLWHGIQPSHIVKGFHSAAIQTGVSRTSKSLNRSLTTQGGTLRLIPPTSRMPLRPFIGRLPQAPTIRTTRGSWSATKATSATTVRATTTMSGACVADSLASSTFPEPAKQNAMTRQEQKFPVQAQDKMEKFRLV